MSIIWMNAVRISCSLHLLRRVISAPVLLCLFFICALPLAAKAQALEGTYRGLDGATGITIRLSSAGGGYVGEIIAGSGGRADLTATAIPGGARGPLTLKGQSGTVDLLSQPLGLSMVWRPDNGGSELVYAFRHERLTLPTKPPGYTDPPPPGATRVNPISFLTSYEFWEPAQVGRAYDGLDDKYRVLMKAFATVHTDILWKLCLAPVAPDQLVDALRGEGVTCADLRTQLRDSQRDGAFMNYKRAVHAQKADAMLAVECARGINPVSVCAQAARRTQAATLSLETVGSVLNRF